MKMVVSFKIDSRIKEAIQKLADKENRSLSNYIVTVLMKHLEEKDVLLKEVHHRVKNNLQLISSLLELQKGKTENEEVFSFFSVQQCLLGILFG